LIKLQEFAKINSGFYLQTFLIAFLILNSVWLIPGTIAIRYFVIFIGLLVFSIQIAQFQLPKFSLKNYFPGICLFALFIWVVFHRVIITDAPSLMNIEINTIWKRAIVEGLFGFGLGVMLSLNSKRNYKNFFLFALFMPVVMFFLSSASNFLTLDIIRWNYSEPEKPYISKYQFVLFAIIAYSWILFNLVNEINKLSSLKIILRLGSLLTIALSIFLVNGKNGFLYMGLILIAVMIQLLWKNIRNIKIILLVAILFLSSAYIGYHHVKSNPVWTNLIEDIEVARHTDKIQIWKNYRDGELDELQNASGKNVSNTTYFRTAWLIEGGKLVLDNPLGYGLIQNSFKFIAKKEWPDSNLSHTHSGWLDIILGLGIPGFLLILASFVALIKKGFSSENFYAKSAIWVLPTIFLAFLTSELSEKISFEVMIYYLAFYCGSTLKSKQKIDHHS
jgi:hypothetical protein